VLFGRAHPLQLMALMAMPMLPGNGINDIFTNRVFLAGFWAWFTAQTLKVRWRPVRFGPAPHGALDGAGEPGRL
jgi:hypothetical protein